MISERKTNPVPASILALISHKLTRGEITELINGTEMLIAQPTSQLTIVADETGP